MVSVQRATALAAGGAGDKERVQRMMRLKKIKDSGGSYESLLNEVRTTTFKMISRLLHD